MISQSYERLPVRVVLGALALFGVVAAFGISQTQWMGISPCPSIGIVPACYVVLVGYLLMMISAIIPSRILFLTGWLPVFLLAAVGTVSELLSSVPVCPRTESGIPQCYLSLGLVSIIGLVALFTFKKRV
jgi:hypothetical protein